MPPQSRGGSPEPEKSSLSTPRSVPPTLRPFLETLPSPTALPLDQRTPTGPRFPIPDRDGLTPTPTPTSMKGKSRARFHLGDDDESNHDEQGSEVDGHKLYGEDAVEGMTLDDDDFTQHYSRQESEEDDDEEEDREEEDDEDEDDEEAIEDEATESEHPPPKPGQGDGESSAYFAGSGPGSSLSRVHSLPAQPPPPPARRPSLHTSQSTTSLPPAPPLPLYPPFYNRPPTPLPPSPSLTSLLRPPSLLARSATSTRPTTPDSSDVETPNDTEAAVAHSARRATPLPPTSPKVPTYEYYGFVLYLASSLAFLMYILWSYLPSPFLHALGITYYPNRWWSLAIPAWIVTLLIFIYVALLLYNVEYLTLPMNSLECMVDEAGNVAILEHGRVRKGGSKKLVRDLEERARMDKEREKMEKSRKKYGSVGKKKRKGKSASPSKETPSAQDHLDLFVASPMSPAAANGAAWSSSHVSSRGHGHAAASAAAAAAADEHNWQTGLSWKTIWSEGTDGVMDVPIGGVCEVLYGE